jgi:hypothetical protein
MLRREQANICTFYNNYVALVPKFAAAYKSADMGASDKFALYHVDT